MSKRTKQPPSSSRLKASEHETALELERASLTISDLRTAKDRLKKALSQSASKVDTLETSLKSLKAELEAERRRYKAQTDQLKRSQLERLKLERQLTEKGQELDRQETRLSKYTDAGDSSLDAVTPELEAALKDQTDFVVSQVHGVHELYLLYKERVRCSRLFKESIAAGNYAVPLLQTLQLIGDFIPTRAVQTPSSKKSLGRMTPSSWTKLLDKVIQTNSEKSTNTSTAIPTPYCTPPPHNTKPEELLVMSHPTKSDSHRLVKASLDFEEMGISSSIEDDPRELSLNSSPKVSFTGKPVEGGGISESEKLLSVLSSQNQKLMRLNQQICETMASSKSTLNSPCLKLSMDSESSLKRTSLYGRAGRRVSVPIDSELNLHKVDFINPQISASPELRSPSKSALGKPRRREATLTSAPLLRTFSRGS
jgi:hypothetical protein